MGGPEMVVAIVALVMVAGVLRTFLRSRTTAGLSREQEGRITRLEERVKALEAVVGDSSYELKQKLRELERA